MGKIYMNELADMLSQKSGIDKRSIQSFLTSVVETIQDGISEDKIVKIKGLGTFKVIDVDARESVNVNTGERVTISGHQKLTFTPDSTMKELVNKPFSQFDTVVLNDGVEFDDIDAESTEEEEPQMEVVEGIFELSGDVNEPLGLVVDTNGKVIEPVEEIAEPAEELVEPAEETEELVNVEDPVVEEEAETAEELIDETPDTPNDENHSYWWLWLLIAIAACVLCFTGGYLLGRHVDRNSQNVETVIADTLHTTKPEVAALPADTVKTDTLKTVAMPADTVKTDAGPESAWKKYEAMDARVRTGAYSIIGDDYELTVKAGDTMKRIAKRTLGEDMECYIEVYNNLSSSQQLKEGQKLMIPKLELKKRMKKNTN